MPQNRIRELRQEQRLSQKHLADAMGVDHSTISRWEAGLVTIPDPLKAQLAEFFAVSVPHLMGWDDGNGDNGERAVA